MTIVAWILVILGLLCIWLGIDTYLKSRGTRAMREPASNPILDLILKLLGWLLDQPGGGWVLFGLLLVGIGGHMLTWWDLAALVEAFAGSGETSLRMLLVA